MKAGRAGLALLAVGVTAASWPQVAWAERDGIQDRIQGREQGREQVRDRERQSPQGQSQGRERREQEGQGHDQASGRNVRNANSGKCLLVRGDADGAKAAQSSCSDYPDQKWRFILEDADSEYKRYRLVNANSGKCLLVRGPEGSPALQSACGDYDDQVWEVMFARNGYFQLRNLASQQCLVVRGDEDNAHPVQSDCDTAYTDQFWRDEDGSSR
ncbi:RICIN domain-containing protein [Streptosporangium pseudovulgare]|uniref:RICIN domain-containing protein n=1 Tax=Streptosporangium pseudovulgare TaxID=35765 RepID=UPI001E5ABA5F|nr:RICIN domain-containing protein [Streptosporangium pseudovulgare]